MLAARQSPADDSDTFGMSYPDPYTHRLAKVAAEKKPPSRFGSDGSDSQGGKILIRG